MAVERILSIIAAVAAAISLVSCGEKSGDGGAGGGSGSGGSQTQSLASTDCIESGQYRAFVTSNDFTGDLATEGGAGTGVLGADALCAEAANQAGLSNKYMAIVSGSGNTAKDRLSFQAGSSIFVVTDSDDCTTELVSLGSELFDTSKNFSHAINYNEYGVLTSKSVWTGTTPSGDANGACADFEDTGPFSVVGNSAATGSTWTSSFFGTACHNELGIYCVSQD